ncbi:hypothetical protein B0H10DRAFT_2221211 [Mycena sp. CBHHK59/15]|nr:hypothetical protein B0H10DRAFT_1972120 [Mycena sp. CBHHK59/15]KAJ6548272.1 hypothetical protein B0H10DRAFT_1969225 [Mycena sp. CBHHK59/15]KAJ6603832.1 hypothetical protein B0H10DRAFT_2314795 [Mycena sp. CBHHK59/15]KAJ6614475.1 hypothetical protein B0H10DRAFT_2221211 [Mycena sp. CBHHK59/15]
MLCTPPLPALTAAEDKALKLEAMRKAGQPATPQLKVWLNHYRGPSPSKMLPSCSPNFHQRKRAELVARVAAKKARHDHLMDLRAQAIKASAHKWLRPRCHPHNGENQERQRAENRAEETRKVVEHAKERAAAKVRVGILMQLCAGNKGAK